VIDASEPPVLATRPTGVTFRALVAVVVWSCGVSGARADGDTGPKLPTLHLLAADAVVGESLPTGWSDLVVKSRPVLESGDIDALPALASTTATLFRTVILADVRPARGRGPDPQPGGYRLARVGLGICVPVGGAETVVTEANSASPRVGFGMIERQVFATVFGEIKKARMVARTPTLAVLAAPALLTEGDRHVPVYLVYALAVDPTSGRLTTAVWSLTVDAARRSAPKTVTLLKPGAVDRSGLDVRAARLFGTIPLSYSFALRQVPKGQPRAVGDALRPWLADLNALAARPAPFEAEFRSWLAPSRRRDQLATQPTAAPASSAVTPTPVPARR